MPFTLSHPAAVLPLIVRGRGRGPLSASALVAGSMAPDVPYFADSVVPGVFGFGTVTHAWWGVFTVDVLIAAALAAAWRWLLRDALAALLPLRRGTAGAPGRPGLRGAGWFAVSGALGAATHVGWDSFTHHDRAGVRLLPFLERTGPAGQPLYTVLQYGSSALALGCLAWWLLRAIRRWRGTAVDPRCEPAPGAPGVPGARVRSAVFGALVAGAAAGAALRIERWSRLRAGASGYEVIPTVAFGSLAGAGVVLLVWAVLYRILGRNGLARGYDRAA